jgi:hypothetical protein
MVTALYSIMHLSCAGFGEKIESNIADGHCSVSRRNQSMVRLRREMFGSHIGAADGSSLLITYFPPRKTSISSEKKTSPKINLRPKAGHTYDIKY